METRIYGLQKLTLLDYPETVACTVFLSGCNFKCPWCHNYNLVNDTMYDSYISENEFFDFLKSRKNVLEGVAITGGEPCLNKDLSDFIRRIKDMEYKVKLDTNGSKPWVLKELLDTKLVDYVAMDIKNSFPKYGITVGRACSRHSIATIKDSIRRLFDCDIPYEFRTTVVDELHEENDFHAIGNIIKGARKYYLQPFKDSDSVPYKYFHTPDNEKLQECLRIARKYVPTAEIRGA